MASSPYSISLNATVINQISNMTHKTNASVVAAFAGGNVKASALFQGETPHSSNFSSTDLLTLLGLNTNTFISAGLCVSGAVTSVPFRLRADCAEFAAGSTHSAIQCSNTLVTLDSISAKINESAKADCTLRYKASDGFTSPVSFVSSIALTDAAFIAEYMLHSVVVNDIVIPELQGIEISTGLKVIDQKSPGPFTIAHFIQELMPTISITTENLAYAGAVINAAPLGTGVLINFAKRKSGGIIEDLEDEVHLQIGGAVGIGHAESMGGDARAVASNAVKLQTLTLTAVTGVALE